MIIMIISFGDRKAFNNYYIYEMKLIKKENDYRIYRTLLTDGFYDRYKSFLKDNENNLQIRKRDKVYRCEMKKSKKVYEQECDDYEGEFGIILFPLSYYKIKVYKNETA